jgi:1-acyl-sn-glycerol-3-phosphate acyltransferase
VKSLRDGIVSAFLWTFAVLHFFPMATLLVVAVGVVSPRRLDPIVRVFFRSLLRSAGARLRVVQDPAFDPTNTVVFVSNHVNLFDPFVVYSAIPQFIRGIELESHFEIPVYGWLMKRFGNLPVSDRPTRATLNALRDRCGEALRNGISLMVFAEGSRTRTGRVGPFKMGAFRIAREHGFPIVPVSIVGAYEWKRVGDWRLRPSTVTVYLHAPLEVIDDESPQDLAERVRRIVSAPVDAPDQRAD